MADGEQSDMEGEEVPEVVLTASLGAKLQELLHYVTSTEIKLCADATKEFIKLLKSTSGGELLHLYLRTSAKCLELLEAWKLRQGKPGISYVFSLISAILSHPDGKYGPREPGRIAVYRALDSFARLLLDEKLQDVYKELNSKEGQRQKAALQLMGSIVRRGSDMASEVAKKFDFSLQAFKKIAENRRKQVKHKAKHSMRKSFIGFAMSFLEVGRPGLLRWILQQKDMYSGVLRGLGNDEDETIIYVLSTLRDRVLTEESLVPPGLRSVLFGSITLEQLVTVSGRENGGTAAELAHRVLIMACTDPSNGLMSDSSKNSKKLRGNPKRLLDLMKKLNATETRYHKDLLLALVRGRPYFGSAYLEEFPYNVEDHASVTWFSAISLAADVVSSVGAGNPFGFLDSVSYDPPPFDGVDVQPIIKCVCPRPFSRSIMNKGLLHSDVLVKNGTLRLLLEELKLLDSFFGALEYISCAQSVNMVTWESLKTEIQNEVRTMLPDPQVLLSLLSSLSSNFRANESPKKRKTDCENSYSQMYRDHAVKKMKTRNIEEDTDIIVAGFDPSPATSVASKFRGTMTEVEELDNEKDLENIFAEIWGFDPSMVPVSTVRDVETHFYSKILHAVQIYHHVMPTTLEGSFDFFVSLFGDALALPVNLLTSILSLLKECIRWSGSSNFQFKAPPQMYKHLQPFINLLFSSHDSSIKDQAYCLSVACMLSTGAFDGNAHEVEAWFLFLPGYNRNQYSAGGVEALQGFSHMTISFLCDAVSTVGNNLFKFWEILRCNASKSRNHRDCAPNFGPLTICVLQKCLRVLKSESGSFSLPDKTIISFYVCNTMKYLLQTQVDAGPLSATIISLISESIAACVNDSSGDLLCEWRPLKSLLLFAQGRLQNEAYPFCVIDENAIAGDSSLASMQNDIKELLRIGQTAEIFGITRAFSSSIICTSPSTILHNFLSVITISKDLDGVPISILSLVFFLDESFLARISKMWPKMFLAALQMVASRIGPKDRDQGAGEASSHSFCSEEIHSDNTCNASEPASAAFSFLLDEAPFHVLFPAIMSLPIPFLSESLGVYKLLSEKLLKLRAESLVSCMRLVLFWVHQLQLANATKLTVEIERLSEICIGLLKHILARVIACGCDSVGAENNKDLQSTENIKEVARSIFCHPAVIWSITGSLDLSEELPKENLAVNLDASPSLSLRSVLEVDIHILNIVETASRFFLAVDPKHSVTNAEEIGRRHFAEAYNSLVKRVFVQFRYLFDICVQKQTVDYVMPTFNALFALVCSLSPYGLLELVHWLFGRVNVDGVTISEMQFRKKALSLGCLIASCAYENLITYMQQPISRKMQFDLLWETGKGKFDCNIIEEMYVKVLEYALLFEVDFADTCLLKTITVVYRERSVPHLNLHPLGFLLSRVIAITPVEMLSYCMKRTNEIKAKILFLLTELSSLHLSIFGFMFSSILANEDHSAGRNCASSFSSEELLMLLPAALSFLNSISVRYGKQYRWRFRDITLLYGRILLDGFREWESFVSQSLFQEECDESPSSVDELLKFVEGTFLGKAVNMLQYYLILNSDSLKVKKRLKLFDSILPSSASHRQSLGCDIRELDSYSLEQSLNAINKFLAKVSLCRMLLFPEYDQVPPFTEKEPGQKIMIPEGIGSDGLCSSRIRLIGSLVSTWKGIVKKFPLASDGTANGERAECLSLYNYLEDFILRSIEELTAKIHNDLVQMNPSTFLEDLIRSSLLYRFEDPKTMRMLRQILSLLSQGQFSYAPYLQLLLAHSQFPHILHSISKSSHCLQLGAFLRPMSSILRSVVTSFADKLAPNGENVMEKSKQTMKKIEVLKLLRTLLQPKGCEHGTNSEKEDAIDPRNLLFLILSSYGATLSEIDLELYNLIQEIESSYGDSVNLSETNFLWGSSALKFQKEWLLEQSTSSEVTMDTRSIEQRRRSQVRENLPIDPKLCASTVLYFPYDRAAYSGPLCSESTYMDDIARIPESHTLSAERRHGYDPLFIMRFSLHVLSIGFIEPVEFASLGLLAVAFACLSSLDDGIRKLGYETLAKFKDALEKCKKRKDVVHLRLLLNYVQNGVEEPWQRIPSVISLFAAEASLVLLDPSHEHYATISKLLMRSSRVNMKSVPLFSNFLWSSNINFKSERLWILRLIYVALKIDDDAPVFIRNSVFENLLSFYSSPVSDDESKGLILQIIKKSVKLPKAARYLVEHCGLFSWLLSALTFITDRLATDDKNLCTAQLMLILEVVHVVILSRNVSEWLQKFSFEQLAKLSAHLFYFLQRNLKLINEGTLVVDLVLQIMMSTLKMSHKRKIYQPHFTLSVEGIFQIHEAVSLYDNTVGTLTSEHGLRVILMSTPTPFSNMGQQKVSKFVTWAISTAQKSDSKNMLAGSHAHRDVFLEEDTYGEPLKSKLLRWLVASVIHGKLYQKSVYMDDRPLRRSNLKNLKSMLECVKWTCGGSDENTAGHEEVLAAALFYLQQLVGTSCKVHASVVSALCVLHLDSCRSPESLLQDALGSTLLSKIHCPPEANPSWRWSFYQPWKDLTSEKTDCEKMDEYHACQTLLVLLSDAMRKQIPLSDEWVLLPKDVETCGVFEWERNIISNHTDDVQTDES